MMHSFLQSASARVLCNKLVVRAGHHGLTVEGRKAQMAVFHPATQRLQDLRHFSSSLPLSGPPKRLSQDAVASSVNKLSMASPFPWEEVRACVFSGRGADVELVEFSGRRTRTTIFNSRPLRSRSCVFYLEDRSKRTKVAATPLRKHFSLLISPRPGASCRELHSFRKRWIITRCVCSSFLSSYYESVDVWPLLKPAHTQVFSCFFFASQRNGSMCTIESR